MMISSSGVLMDTLRQQDLLTPEQLAELPRLTKSHCSDARSFAKVLIQRGWLSVYQVNQLLAGNTSDLVIGPYLVLDKLGQGGLSQVFKGRHRESGDLVAVKMIKAEVFADAEGRQQFLQEVEAMARLDHENVVQFCDADQWKDTYFFAMEYVEGTDLGKVIRLSGALPVYEACDCIRQSALGLQHAFERNLIHRDIKPVNLFLTEAPLQIESSGTALVTTRMDPAARGTTRPLIKILDWGLASLRKPKGKNPEINSESLARNIVGTADYLAPEQARNANVADIRSDIYSLGCTFYFLLTGQPPFPDGTLMQKILHHQQSQPRSITEFRDDVPTDVAELLDRMMAKDPADRIKMPASIALALTPHARRKSGLRKTGRMPTLRLPPRSRDDTPIPPALAGLPKPAKAPDDTLCGTFEETRKAKKKK
jgi:eukaryotic-like serine/threonine-protein kinase